MLLKFLSLDFFFKEGLGETSLPTPPSKYNHGVYARSKHQKTLLGRSGAEDTRNDGVVSFLGHLLPYLILNYS